jgi:MFS transporter, DHA1 family, inner membrane transport protein
MNVRVLVLAACTFAVGTGTFVVAGLLGAVAEDLSVSVGAAGHLVTVFAVSYAVGSPALVAATGRVGRRRLLVASMLVFALANAAAAVVPTYPLLLSSRVAAACGAAVIAPVASAVAAEIVSPEHRGRALSVAVGGLSVAWVVGVPLGTLVGDLYGWRVTFLLVAALALAAALAVGALIPSTQIPPPQGIVSRLSVAGHPAVLVVLGVTLLGLAATFVVLTYVRPVLEAITGFGPAGIGAMFLLFGLASIAGTILGGYGADRLGYRANAVPILVVLALSLLSFSLLAAVEAGTTPAILGAGAAVVAWCASGYALLPLQQHRLLAAAPKNASGVLSLNASAIYAGQGLGAIIGSLVLANISLAALGLAGALCALVALAVLALGATSGFGVHPTAGHRARSEVASGDDR